MRLSAFVLFCVSAPALAQTNDPSSAAKAAWARMLKARGMDQASIRSVAVTEQSSRAKLKATYVHSDGSGWWIFWDHRPTPLGGVLEVYDSKARTGAIALAQRDEFVHANTVADYDRRIDFRLQFLAIYEPNSVDLQAIPSSIRPCEHNRDCLTVSVKDRVITYQLDRKTSLPAKIILDIPPQPAGPGGSPSTAAMSMETELSDYKDIDGILEPQKLERHGASYRVQVFLNPPLRSDLFNTSFSHTPADSTAWRAR